MAERLAMVSMVRRPSRQTKDLPRDSITAYSADENKGGKLAEIWLSLAGKMPV